MKTNRRRPVIAAILAVMTLVGALIAAPAVSATDAPSGTVSASRNCESPDTVTGGGTISGIGDWNVFLSLWLGNEGVVADTIRNGDTYTYTAVFPNGVLPTGEVTLDYLIGADTGAGGELDAGKVNLNGCDTPPPVDICPNLDGVQTEVPKGHEIDEAGNCVKIPKPPKECPDGYELNDACECVETPVTPPDTTPPVTEPPTEEPPVTTPPGTKPPATPPTTETPPSVPPSTDVPPAQPITSTAPAFTG